MFRILSLLAGGLILLAPPLLLGDALRAGLSGWQVAGALAGLVLVAGSFLFVGVTGHRFRRSPPLRRLAGLLLAVPFAASAAALWHTEEPDLLWASGLVLSLTVVLFVAFVYPASSQPKHRPMRARERAEPTLVRLVRR